MKNSAAPQSRRAFVGMLAAGALSTDAASFAVAGGEQDMPRDLDDRLRAGDPSSRIVDERGQRQVVGTRVFDKGGAVFNVRHPDFGAVGDGIEDDTDAIQAALDSANVPGMGAAFVYIPEGVYVVRGLRVGSQVTLGGAGWGSVLLHKANSSEPLVATDDPAATVQVCVRDLLLDGNKADQESVLDAIHLDATGMASGTLVRHRLYNLYIRNARGSGVHSDFPGRQSFFVNINCRACDKYSFELGGTESHLTNCVSQNAGLQGFYCTGDSMSFMGCRSGESGQSDPRSGDGFLMRNATRVSMANCVASSNQAHGFHFWGDPRPMEGPTIVNCHSINDNQMDSARNGFQFNNVARATGASLKVTTTDGPGVDHGLNFINASSGCRIDISSQGHKAGVVSYLPGNVVNGLGAERADAERPTTANWGPGDFVEFTDSIDGSGDGLYLLRIDGTTWTKLA